MKIYISGFMGSGKSHMGRQAAQILGCPEQFTDLDELVEIREQMTIPQLFNQRGEEGFRLAEYRALTSSAADIIALGGGTLTFAPSAEFIRASGRVIFLDTGFDLCFQRIEGDQNRPNAADLDKQSLELLFELRHGIYLDTADAVFKPGSAKELARMIARLR
jgi:shikimate kinase